jgi:hypothetical protein
MGKDWIPTRELDKLELMKAWKDGLANADYRTQFGWRDEACEALIARIDSALAAHTAYVADIKPALRIVKDHSMKGAVEGMRRFANGNIRFNEMMGSEYKVIFGIREPDAEPTPGGAPQTKATITTLKPLGGAAIEIRFQDETTPHSRAIPVAYNGCLLAYTWGPEKTGDIAALTQTDLMTHHIWRLALPPEAATSWLSLAVRWQSRTGEKGLWSPIHHIAVS